MRVRSKEEEDAEDRKRLKERLKEALTLEKQGRLRGVDQDERETWAEYIFGIARPNGRVGKTGSRLARRTTRGAASARRLTPRRSRGARRAGSSTRSRASCKVTAPAAAPPVHRSFSPDPRPRPRAQASSRRAGCPCSTRPWSCRSSSSSGTTTTRATSSPRSTSTWPWTSSSWSAPRPVACRAAKPLPRGIRRQRSRGIFATRSRANAPNHPHALLLV